MNIPACEVKCRREERISMACMVLTGILWSMSGLFAKILPWNALITTCLRGFIVAVTLTAYMLLKKIRICMNKRILLMAIFLALCNFSFMCANKLTTSANAVVLQYTCPIYILLFSVIFKKQKLHLADSGAVAFTFFGIVIIFYNQISHENIKGDLLGALSGIFMACMHITNGSLAPAEHLSGLMLGQLLNGIFGIPFLFLYEAEYTPCRIGMLLFMGIVQIGVSYLLFDRASKHCKPLMCSLLSTIEPILNPIWVFFLLGEKPGGTALLGGSIVIATITLWCIYKDKKAAQAA